MKRRPHWDDELIVAVAKAVWDDTPAPEYVWKIIAAVEDWQAEKRRGEAAFSWLMARDARQEAAIQRVRERAGGPTPAVYGGWMAGYAAAMRDILRALDGAE